MQSFFRSRVTCRAVAVAAVLLGFIAIPSVMAEAVPLFMVDTSVDALIVVESSTGQFVGTVGALGVDMVYCGALVNSGNGHIYGLCFNPGVGGSSRFVQISTTTGAVVMDVLLPVSVAEGMAIDYVTGQVYVTFGTGPNVTQSDRIGIIDPATGNIQDLGLLNLRADDEDDAEGIGFGPGGAMYLVDGRCCGRGSDVYLMEDVLNGTLVGSFPASRSYSNAVEFLYDGTMLVLETEADLILVVSLADGAILEEVPLPRAPLSGMTVFSVGPTSTSARTWGAIKANFDGSIR
jgi:hypothetical protein